MERYCHFGHLIIFSSSYKPSDWYFLQKKYQFICANTASNTEISSRISSHFTIEKQFVICRTPPQAVIDTAIFAEGWIHLQLFSCEICRRYGGMEARFKKKNLGLHLPLSHSSLFYNHV